MARTADNRVREYQEQWRVRSFQRAMLVVLGCVVAFCVSYVLITPAVTLEAATSCGLEEHLHTESCFDTSGNLTCNKVEHVHTSSCSDASEAAEGAAAANGGSAVSGASAQAQQTGSQQGGAAEVTAGAGSASGSGNSGSASGSGGAGSAGGANNATAATSTNSASNTSGSNDAGNALSAQGDGYAVTVNFTDEAGLPSNTQLEVREILSGTSEYDSYAAQAAEATGEAEGEETPRRFFDITLMSNGAEVEPAAPVQVTMSFGGACSAGDETVVHFPTGGGVELLSATADADGLHYEQDGFSVVGFTASSIDTSKTYALVYGGYALTVDAAGNLTAESVTGGTPNASHVRWQFVYQSGSYRVKTTVGSTDYYLTITRSGNYGNFTYGVGLTTNAGSNTSFTATLNASANPNTVTLQGSYQPQYGQAQYRYVTMNGTTLGVNQTSGTEFSLYYDPDAGKVATISPSSTVIDLFDYRVGANWNESTASSDTGINEGHTLKFSSSPYFGAVVGTANRYTGDKDVLQGIVESSLGLDGYPVLSDKKVKFTGANNQELTNMESLSYLFDPNDIQVSTTRGMQTAKKAYTNVKGLLQLDSNGYYYYDCTKNYAEFPVNTTAEDGDTDYRESTNNNRFNVYETDNDQFFPFDPYMGTSNHFFGLHMKTHFIQNYNGYAKPYTDGVTEGTPTTFEFSGDDDVWIFVDGVLVADLGGIHGSASVTINFAKGTVTISNVYENKENVETNFSDIFTDTGVELANYDGKTTLVNNSSHTLDFFYLERGAGQSNMKMKYNLLEIPATSIYKVDQYGDTLAGAEFAVYGATEKENGDYSYNTDQVNTDESAVAISLSGMTYWDGTGDPPAAPYWKYRGADESGGDKWDILVTSVDAATATPTTTIIPCKYHGVTDSNGEMIFQTDDGSILSLDNMAALFGSHHFILREVDVPDGYRTVSDESWFHIDPTAGVMLCDSTYTSGVWASNNANVTAANTLYTAIENPSETDKAKLEKMGFTVTGGNTHYSFNGYMTVPEAGTEGTVTMKGTLFAVVLKRNEKTLDKIDEWYPVYGSDNAGYQLVQSDEDSKNLTGISAVIAAAQKQEKLTGIGSATFTPSTLGGGVTAQVVLENLPGKIDRYYTYMQQKSDGNLLTSETTGVSDSDPQYFVAYYYTSASSIDDATAENTVRVYSRANVISDTGYQPFEIAWGTTIEVPNMENRLFFQKTNGQTVTTTDTTTGEETSSLELLDGAAFALYEAYEAPNAGGTANIVYYVGEDKDGKTVYVGLYTPGVAGYEPNKAIVFSDPADTGGTSTSLGIGKYEIDKNFTVNITKDETTGLSSATIVPDEGSEPGRITVTIDNGDGTTTQYYIHPATNAASTPEALVGVTHDVCSTVKEEGTGHFTKLKSGKYYLREIMAPTGYAENTTDIPVLVDDNGVYANAGDADNKVAVGNGLGYLSKTLDVFASQNEIDESLTWVYGALIQNNASGFTAFQNVDGDVLKVGDGSSGWMFVTQDPTASSGYGTGTSTNRKDAMVVYMEYSGSLTKTETSPLFDYLPNTDQNARTTADYFTKYGTTAPETFVETQSGETDVLRLWTQEGWSDLAVYQDYAYGHSQNPNTTYYQDLTASGNISNLFSSSTFVQVTDEKLVDTASVDVTLNKVSAEDGTTPLAGAAFRLYKYDTDGETKLYYAYNETGKETTWVTNPDQATTLTTLADGTLSADDINSDTFHVLPSVAAGFTIHYYLEETVAPDGYNLMTAPIEIHVDVTGTDGTLAVTLGSVGDWNGTTTSETTTDEAGNITHRAYLYTLTVPNSTGYALPQTGGIDVRWCARAGALLLLCCGAGRFLLWRKKVRGKGVPF